MNYKLSFKKDPLVTGLAGVGAGDSTTIKLNKKEWGSIFWGAWQSKDNRLRITLKVVKKDIIEDKNPKCPWKWITLKANFENETEAREWLKTNLNKILESFTPFLFED